jgi:hypothetical protein
MPGVQDLYPSLRRSIVSFFTNDLDSAGTHPSVLSDADVSHNVSLPLSKSRADYEYCIRSSAPAPVFTSTRTWDTLTLAAGGAPALTSLFGGKVSKPRVLNTCTLSDS